MEPYTLNMQTLSSDHDKMIRQMFLEYIKTGEECYKKIIDCIQNGCVGDLNLYKTQITSLPEGLGVGGDLDLYDTPISKKYTKEELRKMLPNVNYRLTKDQSAFLTHSK